MTKKNFNEILDELEDNARKLNVLFDSGEAEYEEENSEDWEYPINVELVKRVLEQMVGEGAEHRIN